MLKTVCNALAGSPGYYPQRRLTMKKILTLIVTALIAVSFASVAVASAPVKEEVKTESTVVTPAGETKTDKKELKKSTTMKKGGKKVVKKSVKEETTTKPAAKGKKEVSGC
jgi:hypothetical protein